MAETADVLPLLPEDISASKKKPTPDVLPLEKPVGAEEAALRGVQSGFMFGYGPQITAAAKASGMTTEGEKAPPAYLQAGPVETLVGAGRLGLEALAPSVFGTSATERYQRSIGEEKAARAAAREQHPIASGAGELTGAVINPLARVGGPKAGETFTSNVIRGAVPNAVVGGIYGSSEGDTFLDRAYNAALGALGGGVFGGLFSGVGGKFMGAAKPSVTGVPSPEEVARAAARLSSQGAAITVPRVAASTSEPLLTTSGLVREIPIAGTPLKRAGEETLSQIETKAGEIAGGETRGSAGLEAKSSLENWISKGWKKDVESAYDEVDNLLTSNRPASMKNTRATMDKIQAELREARLPTDTPAIKLIQDAATDPNGLSYQGMKTLRTTLGEMLDNPSEIYKDALPQIRRLYGSVTDDLRDVVKLNGGKDALSAFEDANRLNIEAQRAREQLLKITGQTTASKSGDAVFDTLYKMAGSKAGSDIPKLELAKETLPKDVWETISRGMVDHMGTNPKTNAFDANSLFSNYARLSEGGKNLLFGEIGQANAPMRRTLDDLATVGSRIDRINALAAPEGGAERKLATAGEIVAAILHPVKTTAAIGAGRVFANLMSEPATAESIARWAKAYEMFASKPSKATATAFSNYTRAMAQQVGGRYGLPSTDQIVNGIVAGSETAKGIRYLYNQAFGNEPERKEGPNVYPEQASGGRVGHAFGGKAGGMTAEGLLRDLKRRKVMMANKTEQMLSLPDDAVVQALDAAKR